MAVLVVARAQAILDRIVPLLCAGGISAVGTTDDADAVAQLRGNRVAALVIGGGVEPEARQRLRAAAATTNISVIDGAARGKEHLDYVRDELLPALRRLPAPGV